MDVLIQKLGRFYFKMNRKYWILILGILLVGGVVATTLNSKEAMWDYFMNYKQTRENIIDSIGVDVTYLTDKECAVDYEHEMVECVICFEYEFTIENKITDKTCLTLEEDTTEAEDEERIRTFVRRLVHDEYPIEEIKYIKDKLKDKKIKVKVDW